MSKIDPRPADDDRCDRPHPLFGLGVAIALVVILAGIFWAVSR